MRLGILMAVTFASATLLANGARGLARASDASTGVAAAALPDNPSRDPQSSSGGGAYRFSATQPDHGKPSEHAAGPFSGSFDISTGPTRPDGPDLGSK
jgi:hypothetical protein